jgi:hypothetical protein
MSLVKHMDDIIFRQTYSGESVLKGYHCSHTYTIFVGAYRTVFVCIPVHMFSRRFDWYKNGRNKK